jgi:hypothetical protein
MRPLCYLNIEVRGVVTPGRGFAKGSGLRAVLAVSRIMHALHAKFKEQPDTFATDFPAMVNGPNKNPGHIVRVFAASREALDALAEKVESDRFLSDLAIVGRVRAFNPDTHAGPWVSLRRFRVAPRAQSINRERDMLTALELPFIRTRSSTNGNAYTLTLQRAARAHGEFGCPNSYGLSGMSDLTLPDIPI